MRSIIDEGLREAAAAAGFEQSCEDGVGELLAVLAGAVPSGGRVLELGTGAGVGTAWIVQGLQSRLDVEVVTIELNTDLTTIREAVEWPATVRFLSGDALELVPQLGKFDLVFADATAGKWYGLDVTIEALAPGGLLVVDDMTPASWADEEHKRKTAEVRTRLLAHEQLAAVELPVASGMIVATRSFAGATPTSPASVRRATPEDAKGIAEVAAVLMEPDVLALRDVLRRQLAQDDTAIFVSERSSEVVGFVYVHVIASAIATGGWARLASMAVREDHRRLGVGRELVNRAEQFARDGGASSMELTSTANRTAAHAFYQSVGYGETAGSLWFAKAL
jgi:predicted O-methyltransferase YrrM/GNAT superfamily N-acetyltransferase